MPKAAQPHDPVAHELRQLRESFDVWGRAFLEQNEKHYHKLMSALTDLTDSITAEATAVTGLTVAVDAAVTELQTQGPTDQQLVALKGTVDGLTATLAAQTQRLNDAMAPATPTP